MTTTTTTPATAPTTPSADDLLATAYANDRAHVFHSWSAQASLNPTVIAGAEGCEMWTADGTRYLDFSSQLVNVNLGYQHPRMIAAIQAQAARLCTIGPSIANAERSEAARLIAERAPGTLNRVFFTNGGAEAVENAIRLAKGHTGRLKVLSAYRSYHGATAGAISATGEARRHDSEPGVPGMVKFFGPYLYRSAFHATTPDEECARALQHLRDVIVGEGSDRVAAILLESVVGTNGILVPPDGYLAGVRALCDEFGIVMIADEVMAGFGRCGEWFAINRWDVVPDLITFAKGVNSGYVPLGGVAIADHIADTFADRVFQGGLTYSGHPLACAAAVESISIFEDEGILAHVNSLADEVFGPRLAAMQQNHEHVGEVRGLGSFWAIELVEDPATRVPLGAAAMQKITAGCKAAGLWPFVAANRIHVVPPLVITASDAHRGLDIIDTVLTEAL